MLVIEPLVGSKIENWNPKKLPINATIKNKNIPPIAAKSPSLKFSVALIIPDLYASKSENKIVTVSVIALKTIPSNIWPYIKETPPKNKPWHKE